MVGVFYLTLQGKSFLEQQIGLSDSESRVITYAGNGYEISYSVDWQLDATEQEAPVIVFSSPDGKAKVYIQSLYDPRLTKVSEQNLTIADIKESFTNNPDYTVTLSDKTTVGSSSAYLVEGTFKDQEKKQEFQEYTIFGPDGYYYSLRINNEPDAYQKALDVMVSTFQITAPNEEEVKARNSIEKLVEVQNFKKQVERGGRSTFGIRVDQTPTAEDPYYVVQVYETFPDHTTTFNWYRVSPKTWIVERQDLATDTWEKVK